MQKVILTVIVFTTIFSIQAQVSETLKGHYEYKDQIGVIHKMVLQADSFVYYDASTLEQSRVQGTWKFKANQIILQSDIQQSTHLNTKEKQTSNNFITIYLKDVKGIPLSKVFVMLNNSKEDTYFSDTLGKIKINKSLDIEIISIQYLSYPKIGYKPKNKKNNHFEMIFSPPPGTLYRYFEAEVWEVKKNILIDKTTGFKKRYKKKVSFTIDKPEHKNN